MKFARLVQSAISHHRCHTRSDPPRCDSEVPNPLLLLPTAHDIQVSGPVFPGSATILVP